MSKENQNDGSVPEKFLHQLNEYTAGGFMLFYFNSKDGSPEQLMTFDSPAHCLALQKHILDWSLALQDLQIEGEKQLIQLNSIEQSDSDDDSDVI